MPNRPYLLISRKEFIRLGATAVGGALLAACGRGLTSLSATETAASLPETIGDGYPLVASTQTVPAPAETPTPTQTPTEVLTSTPSPIDFRQEGFEGYKVKIDKEEATTIIDDKGREISPGVDGTFFVKNQLYYWYKKDAKLVEAIKKDFYVQYWDTQIEMYKLVSDSNGIVEADNLVQTSIGAVVIIDEKATTMVFPGGTIINSNYDGSFTMLNKPGWFYVWDGKKVEEKELGEIVEFDRVDMDILGNKVPFTIGTDRNSDIREIWENIRVESLTFNPNNKNIEEEVMKMYTGIMWTIGDAGRKGITYEEYMSDPNQYAISCIPKVQEFFLEDVSQVNCIFLTDSDDRLTIDYGNGFKLGYALKDGVLNIYKTTNAIDRDTVKKSLEKGTYMGQGREQVIGFLMTSFISGFLRLRSDGSQDDAFDRVNKIYFMCGEPKPTDGNLSQYMADKKSHSLWYAQIIK